MNPTTSAATAITYVAGGAARSRTIDAANPTNAAPTHAGPATSPIGAGDVASHTQISNTLLKVVVSAGSVWCASRHVNTLRSS